MKLKFFILFITMFVVGCDSSFTKEYLMQNPRVLYKEFNRCQNNTSKVAYCDMVIESAQEFVKLSHQYAENPQLFAQEIMKVQTSQAELQLKLQQDKNNEQIRQAYKIQDQRLKVLLAVVAEASSPGAL